MIVLALARMRNPGAADVLIELLDDDDVAGHSIMALGRLGSARARPAVERFLEHPNSWVRSEARKTLAKLSA